MDTSLSGWVYPKLFSSEIAETVIESFGLMSAVESLEGEACAQPPGCSTERR
jgi:hypothetical protein